MKKIYYFLGLITCIFNNQLFSQDKFFTIQDTLRGSNTSFRDWWEVKYYDISIEPDFDNKVLKGNNTITFDINENKSEESIMQIDLQEPMSIDKIETKDSISIPFKKEGNFYFITLPQTFKKNTQNNKVTIYFQGMPNIAKNAPWDGGWIFTKDKNNKPWMTVACEGIGASVWFPCKDYLGDEPDEGMKLNIITEGDLKGVGNGRLVGYSKDSLGKNIYSWQVTNPINNYNIIPYIGEYVNFTDIYKGEKGDLDLDYWVLSYNLHVAKSHFSQVKKMLLALEYWFGPYPFYEDGYKLVESPHLGMEHQSDIAYGNQYKNGYLGTDRSHTGIGLQWDFIIVHESGHEWFGNNITNADAADMWIHEAFTTYSETLYTEYYYGKEAASQYIIGQRKNIQNDIPIIGEYGVNQKGSSDMYDKGANMIHTIRQIINDDQKFREILRGLNKNFYHKIVSTNQIENYIIEHSKIDLTKIFDQYLRTTQVPTLEYYIKNNSIYYRWVNTVPDFSMKIKTSIGNLIPINKWKKSKIDKKLLESFSVDPNFYINLNPLKK